MTYHKKKIVVIGGGHGSERILEALQNLYCDITMIVPGSDSGGSTGLLLKQEGFGCTGDLMKCMCSLARNRKVAEMFEYRFSFLDNHSVKNLFFHGAEKTHGLEETLKLCGKMLELGSHRVLPATIVPTKLCARISNLTNLVVGEAAIDTISENEWWNHHDHVIEKIYLSPEVHAYRESVNAIWEADYIIFSQGDLYSSLGAALQPIGIVEAILANEKAKTILIVNLVNKRGETDKYELLDFVTKVQGFIRKELDYIVHNNAFIPKDILQNYERHNKVELVRGSFNDRRLLARPIARIEEGKLRTDPSEVLRAIKQIINRDNRKKSKTNNLSVGSR